MSDYQLVRRDDEPISPSVCEFILRTKSAVAQLPTSTTRGAQGDDTCYPGSVAYTGDLETIYVLGPDNEWREI